MRPRPKALISACYAGDLERVVALLGDGADPSATDVVGWFPLYQAACGGDSHSEDHAKVIATLIDHGVHPDQRTPNGETALMAAAYRGHAPCVAILVMKGADAHTTATDGPWEGRDCFWIAKTSVEQKVIKQEELEVVLAALKLERGAVAPPPGGAAAGARSRTTFKKQALRLLRRRRFTKMLALQEGLVLQRCCASRSTTGRAIVVHAGRRRA